MAEAVNFVTYISNEEEFFYTILSLRSFVMAEISEEKPLVLVPRGLIADFNDKYPTLDVEKAIKNSGGKPSLLFKDYASKKFGMRPMMSRIGRKFGDKNFCYFAPKTFFHNKDFLELLKGPYTFFREADNFWPKIELYGPSLDEIWDSVVKFSGGSFAKWTVKGQPVNYWRRYPAASPRLFYAENAKEFCEKFDAYSRKFIEEIPAELEGLGGPNQSFEEAIMAGFAISEKAAAQEFPWDEAVSTYDDLYDFVLRLSDVQYTNLTADILPNSKIRPVLRKNTELHFVLFKPKLTRIRLGFSDQEKAFGILRMQALIERREIRESIITRVKQLEREEKKAAKKKKAEKALTGDEAQIADGGEEE